MKKFAKSHHGTMNELNITPLLDLAFVLLVIFIIATTPSVNDLDLNLPPKTSTGQKPPPDLPNILVVNRDGAIFLNKKPVASADLEATFKQMKRANTNTMVVVYGTNSVRYQNMVNVFDALQRADVTRVGLATEFPATALNQIKTEN
jgi:biopolymer transport protein ExbD